MQGLASAIADLRRLEQRFERDRALDICMIPFGLDMHSGMDWNAGAILEQCEQLQALGVSWISISLPCDDRSQYLEASSWFAQEVIAPMRSATRHARAESTPLADPVSGSPG